MNAPLVPVTLVFLLGIILGTGAWLPLWGVGMVGIVSAGVALWRRGRTKVSLVAVLLLWGCLGALRITVWERHPDAALKELLSDEPQPVQLYGVVVDDPVELFEPGEAEPDASDEPCRRVSGFRFQVSGWVEARNLKPKTRNVKQVCALSLQHIRSDGGWRPIHGRVRTTMRSPRELLRYGDEIVLEGEWSRVPAPGNPGQYDWQAALARKRIHSLLSVRPYDGIVILERGQGNPLLAAVFRLQQRWEHLIRAHFTARDAGLLLGLLLGQRAEIDEDLKEAFTTTGTIHLVPTQMGRKFEAAPASHVTV